MIPIVYSTEIELQYFNKCAFTMSKKTCRGAK